MTAVRHQLFLSHACLEAFAQLRRTWSPHHTFPSSCLCTLAQSPLLRSQDVSRGEVEATARTWTDLLKLLRDGVDPSVSSGLQSLFLRPRTATRCRATARPNRRTTRRRRRSSLPRRSEPLTAPPDSVATVTRATASSPRRMARTALRLTLRTPRPTL